ncbi:aminoglycoside phosphotransferase family protein [Diaminobutyricibacter tongyongensis]|uniref:Aminoglycoside phosphotransferase family protein n=2 Tax=Leifsonia tongyongensis TaxID=1268043 RepID=A0A6L9XX02_9MICO|nr:aminoglycoside phosphotransferase family protein [Diaminobutyricibacter tongyongensis]
MHADELHLDDAVVARLVAEQFPQWREEPIRRIVTDGTVNAIYRIGSELTARFPLRQADPREVTADLSREAAAMQEFGACCPFPTPIRVAVGVPGHGYPLPWSVQTWLAGDAATPGGLADSSQFARDLAALVRALRGADTGGRTFPGTGRGGRLRDSDEWMEVCFRESEGLLPVARLRKLWAGFRSLPRAGDDVMSHRDLIPANLLVDGEQLVGVLDAGDFAPADPSLDLVAAWHLLDADARRVFRSDLGCGDLEWQRGAAWAFQQAMGLPWYYRDSNPGMASLGHSTLTRILAAPEITPERRT